MQMYVFFYIVYVKMMNKIPQAGVKDLQAVEKSSVSVILKAAIFSLLCMHNKWEQPALGSYSASWVPSHQY